MGSIWSASAVTPAATDRIPVDVSSSGAPSRWTGQNVADAASRIGVTLNALGSINSNTEIDLANGAFVTATITGSLTFTFSNPPATGQGMQFVLVLTDGGSAVVTWPGAVTWTGGTAPTLRASGVDVLRFYTSNGGTNWYGELAYDEQSIDAGAILTGTIDTARLGSGTANSGTFLRGDQTWAAPSGGGSPAGSGTEVQYRVDGTTFGAMLGTAWDNTNRSLTITGATVTASAPVLDMSQTWNNGAVAFTALKVNVTNTASAAASLLQAWQVGGSTVAAVTRAGHLRANTFELRGYDGTTAQLAAAGAADSPVAGTAQLQCAGFKNAGNDFFLGPNGFANDSAGYIGWTSSAGTAYATPDLYLYRHAANVLAQRNGTNGQTMLVFGTFTDASNYVRAALAATSTAVTLTAETAGTGADDVPFTITAGGVAHVISGSPLRLPSFTVATLPSAATAAAMIYVSDESGGAVVAFSDGTNWRRMTDRAIVS